MNVRNNKIAKGLLITLLAVIPFVYQPNVSYAADSPSVEQLFIQIAPNANITIVNAEGEALHYNNGMITGDMQVKIIFGYTKTLEIKASESYNIINHEKKVTYIYFYNGDYDLTDITANGEESINMSIKDGIPRATVVGRNATFNIGMSLQNSGDHNITVIGKTDSVCTVSDTKNGLRIDGITGQFSIENVEVFYVDGTFRSEKSFYTLFSLGGSVLISNLGGNAIKVSGAIVLPSKIYNDVRSLHVQKIADPANPNKLLLYWGKVKNASGYAVYRLDRISGKYERIALLGGKANRAFVDADVGAAKVYKYKVAYFTKKGNKRVFGKKSYWVNSITQNSKYENAYSVKIDKQSVKSKVGKTVKLKATVKTANGKTALSPKVRWYVTNKKVATVSAKGVLKMKKKGTCYVYAKAHDGVDSRKVKVTVK